VLLPPESQMPLMELRTPQTNTMLSETSH